MTFLTTFHRAFLAAALISPPAYSLQAQDGALDPNFQPGAGAHFSSAPWAGTVSSIAVQADGKALIGGLFDSFDGVPRHNIARLRSDGGVDATFDPGTGADGSVDCIAVQPDGRVIIAGAFNAYNTTPRGRIARIEATGTIDPGFGVAFGADSYIRCLAIQPDGKILIVGLFDSYGGSACSRIARLNVDGSVDNSFNALPGADDHVYAIAVQPDLRILAGGEFSTFGGLARNRLVRLNSDGTIDTSFDPGIGTNAAILDLALQSNGSVLIAGEFSTYAGSWRRGLAQVTGDGQLDLAFAPPTLLALDTVNAVAVQPDGKVLIAGILLNRVARLNADGTQDTSFAPASGTNSEPRSLALQSDGKALIGGGFTNFGGVPTGHIARVFATSWYYRCYIDTDGDGFGVGMPIVSSTPCGLGYSSADGDCDDSNPSVNPYAPEICDGLDNDCDGGCMLH